MFKNDVTNVLNIILSLLFKYDKNIIKVSNYIYNTFLEYAISYIEVIAYN